MRVLLASRRVGVILGALILSHTQAFALGCKDIKGAKIDPDLAVMSTVYGRLLPDSKKLHLNRQQSNKIAIERLIAVNIVTVDGSASAQIVLSKADESIVTAQIDGREIKHTIGSKIADLGYDQYIGKITTALENIGRPLSAFDIPKLSSSAALVNLSEQNPKILVSRPVVHIVGTPNTAQKEFISYSCSEDAEFAGNPDILRSMVVMHGVLKATSINQTTTIDRVLDIEVSDFVARKIVTRDEFQALLAQLPGINDSKPPAPKISKKASPVAIKDVTKAPQTNALAPSATNSPSNIKSTPRNMIDLFSLEKPGIWILILLALLLGIIAVLLKRKKPEPRPTETVATPTLAITPTLSDSSDNQNQTPDERISVLKEAAETSEKLQKHLQETLEQANTEITNDAETKRQIDAAQTELNKAKTEAQELRLQNFEFKTKLDKAETISRDLSARVLELQTATALSQNKLTTSQALANELQDTNQTLMGVNEGYREKITLTEAEQTALMLKLSLREGVISQTETLNREMLGLNEEVSHTLVSEKANLETLQKEFDRLTHDYNTLWTQSSSRLAKLRKEETASQSKVRSLNDALLSLGSELEALRKDRKELNRDFTILGNENARHEKEYRANINGLEVKIKELNLKLATSEQLLEENGITAPSMSRLPVTKRDLPKFELGLEEVFEQDESEEADTLDNVIMLANSRTDSNG